MHRWRAHYKHITQGEDGADTASKGRVSPLPFEIPWTQHQTKHTCKHEDTADGELTMRRTHTQNGMMVLSAS